MQGSPLKGPVEVRGLGPGGISGPLEENNNTTAKAALQQNCCVEQFYPGRIKIPGERDPMRLAIP
jgi:hypothetical protein